MRRVTPSVDRRTHAASVTASVSLALDRAALRTLGRDATMSRMGSADVRGCARGLLARVRAERADIDARSTELRARAESVGQMLVRDFGARRVWLFGSLAWGTVAVASDVDLLVEGLDAGLLFRAGAAAEAIVRAEVDLLREEDAPASLMQRVRSEGVVLSDAR